MLLPAIGFRFTNGDFNGIPGNIDQPMRWGNMRGLGLNLGDMGTWGPSLSNRFEEQVWNSQVDGNKRAGNHGSYTYHDMWLIPVYFHFKTTWEGCLLGWAKILNVKLKLIIPLQLTIPRLSPILGSIRWFPPPKKKIPPLINHALKTPHVW